MKILILLVCLINSYFATGSDILSAKKNYENAFKKNEKNLTILREKKDKLKQARERYQLAQYNLKTAQDELATAEADFTDAKKDAKKTSGILKQKGEKLDKIYLNEQ